MTAAASPRPTGCLLILLVLAVPLVYGNFVMFRQWSQARQLDRAGQLTDAVVINAGTAPGPRSIGRNYGVEYRLPANLDPSQQQHHANVNENTYRRAVDYGKIQVKYLPEHPQVQRPVGATSPIPAILILLGFNLAFLFLLVIVFKGV